MRVWLDRAATVDMVRVFPDQKFYSVEYHADEEVKSAILEFAKNVRDFERWARTAQQAIQAGVGTPPVPDFVTAKEAPSGTPKRAAKSSGK